MATTSARLVVIQGPDKGRTYEAPATGADIGRTAQIEVNDTTISRQHARIANENDDWMLRDLDSANGTYVNGVRLTRPVALKHGDQIRMGSTLMVFGGVEVNAGLSVRPSGSKDDLVSLDSSNLIDSAILAALPSNEDSVIMASPESAEAIGNLRALYQLITAIGSIFETEQLLERVMDLIFDKVRFERGFVLMRENPGGNGSLTATPADESDESGAGRLVPRIIRYAHANAANRITISRTIVNHVLRRGEGVLCSNAMTDQRFTKGKSVHNFGIRSAICVPIQARDRILGVIHIDSAVASNTYSPDQLRLMTAIGYQTGLAIENAQLYQAGVRAERLAAIGQTVAQLSHAIKNILQGLRGGADIVQNGLDGGSLIKVKTGWPMVERNLDRIYRLVMNMLAYSKQRQPRLESANLNEVVTEALELIEPQADEKGVMIVRDLADLPLLPLDTEGLHQAVLNILDNALYAISPPNGTIQVQTHYDPLERRVRLTISDNGVGIDPERMAHLFEAFQSSKGQSGTGLGLAVAYKIVREHGGAIQAQSTTGEGTTFTLTFSAQPASPASARSPHEGDSGA